VTSAFDELKQEWIDDRLREINNSHVRREAPHTALKDHELFEIQIRDGGEQQTFVVEGQRATPDSIRYEDGLFHDGKYTRDWRKSFWNAEYIERMPDFLRENFELSFADELARFEKYSKLDRKTIYHCSDPRVAQVIGEIIKANGWDHKLEAVWTPPHPLVSRLRRR
jgi:hypothetical protein